MSPAFSRETLLRLLLAGHLILLVICTKFPERLWMAALLGQAGVILVWVTLGTVGPWWKTAALAALFYAAGGFGMLLDGLMGFLYVAAGVATIDLRLVVFGPPFLRVTLPVLVLLRLAGRRLVDQSDGGGDASGTAATKLSLGELLLLVAIAGAALGLAEPLAARGSLDFGAVCGVIVVGGLWAALASGPWLWRSVVLLLVCIVLQAGVENARVHRAVQTGELRLRADERPKSSALWPRHLWQATASGATALVLVPLGSFLILRACGYRISSIK